MNLLELPYILYMCLPMTTITFKSTLDIDRLEFNSSEDFLMTVFHINHDETSTDFRELQESEISGELKQLIQKSLQKDNFAFSSISA